LIFFYDLFWILINLFFMMLSWNVTHLPFTSHIFCTAWLTWHNLLCATSLRQLKEVTTTFVQWKESQRKLIKGSGFFNTFRVIWIKFESFCILFMLIQKCMGYLQNLEFHAKFISIANQCKVFKWDMEGFRMLKSEPLRASEHLVLKSEGKLFWKCNIRTPSFSNSRFWALSLFDIFLKVYFSNC